MPENIPDDHSSQYQNYNRLEPFQKPDDCRPVLAQFKAQKDQDEVPRQRAQKCIDGEFLKVHFGQAGRDRDESDDDGNKPAPENQFAAVPLKEFFGVFKLMLGNQKILAESFNKPTPTFHRNKIYDDVADEVSGHGQNQSQSKIKSRLAYQETKQRKNDFPGNELKSKPVGNG